MNNIITSEAKFRQRVINYSYKNGITQAIYEWRAYYDEGQFETTVL